MQSARSPWRSLFSTAVAMTDEYRQVPPESEGWWSGSRLQFLLLEDHCDNNNRVSVFFKFKSSVIVCIVLVAVPCPFAI